MSDETDKKIKDLLKDRNDASVSTPENPDPTPDPGPLERPKPVKP